MHGESWFDHEWATNQLAAGQVGWDWLSVQFDDGTRTDALRMRLDERRDRSGFERNMVSRQMAARFT